MKAPLLANSALLRSDLDRSFPIDQDNGQVFIFKCSVTDT